MFERLRHLSGCHPEISKAKGEKFWIEYGLGNLSCLLDVDVGQGSKWSPLCSVEALAIRHTHKKIGTNSDRKHEIHQ